MTGVSTTEENLYANQFSKKADKLKNIASDKFSAVKWNNEATRLNRLKTNIEKEITDLISEINTLMSNGPGKLVEPSPPTAGTDTTAFNIEKDAYDKNVEKAKIKVEKVKRINNLITHLNSIEDQRVLFGQYVQNYKDVTENNFKNTQAELENHFYTVGLGEKYEELLDEKVKERSQGKDNKKRMTEIVNYENKRYVSHQYIFKVLAIGFLFILGGLQFGGPLSWIRNIVVTITTFIILYNISSEIYWNFKRDKQNWDTFNWDIATATPNNI